MTETIYLAGGCFWGLQKFFDQFDGVTSTEAGYANGPDRAPSYQDVCAGSGHAETVKVVYDPARIELAKLLDYYFMVIDPVSVNRQGNDSGVQYRTGIFYTDGAQLPAIQTVFEREQEKAGEKLAVIVEPLKNFFSAEEYHQKYLEKNPGGYCHIPGKYYRLAGKKTLCLFYSRSNLTRISMEKLAAVLDADVREYTDGKERGGALGYLRSCIDSFRKPPAVRIAGGEPDWDAYDKVIVGMPVWAEKPCVIGRGFLQQYGGKIKGQTYLVVTHMAKNDYAKAIEKMCADCGLEPEAYLSVRTKDHDPAEELLRFAESI